MSSFLCFICHSTVNSDTNEETREKYREVVGMHLCPDSHLCYICCHVLNKLWLFKSICLRRSLEYPVLFSEKGTLNVRRNDIEIHTLCPEESCEHHQNRSINYTSYHFSYHNNDNHNYEVENNQYVEFDDGNNYTDVQPKSVKEFQNNDTENDIDDNFIDFDHSNVRNDDCLEGNQDFDNNIDDQGKENDLDKELNNENDLVDTINDKESCINEYNIEKGHVNDYEIEAHDNDFVNLSNAPNSPVLEQDYIKENDDNLNESIGNEIKIKKKKKSKKKGYNKIVLSLEEQKAELEAQRKNKKYLDSEFKCFNCALGFLFKDTYQTHMLRHEESNGEFRCETCTLRFATSSVLRSHVAAHATRHVCTHCGIFVRYRHRHQHSKRCHDQIQDVAACHLCGNVFQDSNGLQQHLRRFHKTKASNRTYSCSVCGKHYDNQAAVRTHMLKHINRKFNCDQCEATFSTPYTLNQHKKKHNIGEKEIFYCSMCNTSYNSRKSLLAHKRNTLKHQQSVLECPICNRVVANREGHVPRVSARATPTLTALAAVCHLCGRGFKSKSKLNRHLREVCEKQKLEEELSAYYEQQTL